MKHYTYIDPSLEEEKVLIYAKERNKIVGEIEELVDSDGINLIGVDEESRDNETVKLNQKCPKCGGALYQTGDGIWCDSCHYNIFKN